MFSPFGVFFYSNGILKIYTWFTFSSPFKTMSFLVCKSHLDPLWYSRKSICFIICQNYITDKKSQFMPKMDLSRYYPRKLYAYRFLDFYFFNNLKIIYFQLLVYIVPIKNKKSRCYHLNNDSLIFLPFKKIYSKHLSQHLLQF